MERKPSALGRIVALGIAMCCFMSAPDAQTIGSEDQDQLVKGVQSTLDGWEGDQAILRDATRTLERVLNDNPDHVQAHIEMARAYVMGGYINYMNFAPGSLDNAERELQSALRSDPRSADAYVLLGRVWLNRGSPTRAATALAEAGKIGTTNPWFELTSFDLYKDLGQWDEAQHRLETLGKRLAGERKPQPRVMAAYYSRLIALREHRNDLPGADAAYRSLLRVDSGSAWNHGNYAGFLLFRRGDPDRAIVQAKKALSIRQYGMGWWTLGAAQYAKWAQLKSNAPAKALVLLAEARANAPDPGSVMVQAGLNADAGPAIQRLIVALRDSGVSLDARDEHGDTGLSLAAFWGRTRSVKWLLEQGADLQARDSRGRDILSMALEQNHREVVRLLLTHGADVNQVGYASRSPLYVAAWTGDPRTVQMLIGFNAVLDVGARGSTPLMAAVQNDKRDAVRTLLAAGADPTIGLANRNSAADMARQRGALDLEAELRAAQNSWTAARR